MQRLVLIASAAALGALLPVVAEAQTPPAPADAAPTARQLGLRYLEWPGKAARPTVAPPASTSTPRTAAAPPASVAPPAARPAPVASPPPQPQPQSQSVASAPPPPYGRVAPSPYQPESAGLTAAAMMPIGPADPMAPRRDAPIFHMASSSAPATPPAAAAPPPPPAAQATTAASSPHPAAPAPTSAARRNDDPRYYSVHRMAGREPDPIPLPAPFFLDAAPVDLAEPPPPPTIVRDGRGIVASAPEPDLP